MIPASTTKRARTRRWADGRRARPIAKARRCGEDDPARRHPTGATTPAIVAGSTRGPSLRLPIGNQSRREDGGYIQTGLEGEHPASSGTATREAAKAGEEDAKKEAALTRLLWKLPWRFQAIQHQCCTNPWVVMLNSLIL